MEAYDRIKMGSRGQRGNDKDAERLTLYVYNEGKRRRVS